MPIRILPPNQKKVGWGTCNVTKSGSLSFMPTYGAGNHISSVPGASISYDGMGNMTSDNLGNTYSYDAEGRPVSVAGVQLTYDALGRVVEKNNGGSYTQTVYSPSGFKFAHMNGTTVQQYFLPLAGGVQAVFNAGGLQYYRHADWLGTVRMITTPSGTVYYDVAYAPFGESYSETGTADRSFTGQTQDTIAGPTALYDFRFRQQASSQGRWLVPDPAGLAAVDVTNPQTWNRYAYVGNNPLSNVDHLGLCEFAVTIQDPNTGNITQICLDPSFGSGGGGGGGGSGLSGGSGNNGTSRKKPEPKFPLVGPTTSSQDCHDLAQQIQSVRNELAGRFFEYNNPLFNLPLFGLQSRAGHIQQIQDKQTQLRNLLNDYTTQGCGAGSLPADAWSLATASAPALTPSPSGLPLPPWVKAVGTGVGIGLVVCDFVVPEVCLPITAAAATF